MKNRQIFRTKESQISNATILKDLKQAYFHFLKNLVMSIICLNDVENLRVIRIDQPRNFRLT